MSKRHEVQPETMAEEEFEQETNTPTQVVVTCDKLNLRKAASPNSQVLYILNKGDVLEVVEDRVVWLKVNFKKMAITGYVMEQFIKNV